MREAKRGDIVRCPRCCHAHKLTSARVDGEDALVFRCGSKVYLGAVNGMLEGGVMTIEPDMENPESPMSQDMKAGNPANGRR